MSREGQEIEKAINEILEEVKGKGHKLRHFVEVIRCKDCKYWDYEADNEVGFCVRTEDCDWNADDFCSRGERAE